MASPLATPLFSDANTSFLAKNYQLAHKISVITEIAQERRKFTNH